MAPRITSKMALDATLQLEKGEEKLKETQRSFAAKKMFDHFKKNDVKTLAEFNQKSQADVLELLYKYTRSRDSEELKGAKKLGKHLLLLKTQIGNLPTQPMSAEKFKKYIQTHNPKMATQMVSELVHAYKVFRYSSVYVRERIFRPRQKLAAMRSEVVKRVPKRDTVEWLSDGAADTANYLLDKWGKSKWKLIAGIVGVGLFGYGALALAEKATKTGGNDRKWWSGAKTVLKYGAYLLGGFTAVNYVTPLFNKDNKTLWELGRMSEKVGFKTSDRKFSTFARKTFFNSLDKKFENRAYDEPIANAMQLLTFGKEMKVKELYRRYQEGRTDQKLAIDFTLPKEITPKQAWSAANIIFTAMPELKDERGDMNLTEAMASFVARDDRFKTFMTEAERKAALLKHNARNRGSNKPSNNININQRYADDLDYKSLSKIPSENRELLRKVRLTFRVRPERTEEVIKILKKFFKGKNVPYADALDMIATPPPAKQLIYTLKNGTRIATEKKGWGATGDKISLFAVVRAGLDKKKMWVAADENFSKRAYEVQKSLDKVNSRLFSKINGKKEEKKKFLGNAMKLLGYHLRLAHAGEKNTEAYRKAKDYVEFWKGYAGLSNKKAEDVLKDRKLLVKFYEGVVRHFRESENRWLKSKLLNQLIMDSRMPSIESIFEKTARVLKDSKFQLIKSTGLGPYSIESKKNAYFKIDLKFKDEAIVFDNIDLSAYAKNGLRPGDAIVIGVKLLKFVDEVIRQCTTPRNSNHKNNPFFIDRGKLAYSIPGRSGNSYILRKSSFLKFVNSLPSAQKKAYVSAMNKLSSKFIH